MKLGSLLTPWWLQARHRQRVATAETIEHQLDDHMTRLRALTSTLEAEIDHMRGEADLER